MPALLADLPMEEVAARYRTGENTQELAVAYGVHQTTISRRLHAAKVKLRCGYRSAPRGNTYGHANRSPGGPLHSNHGYLKTYDRDHKVCLVHRGCWEAYHGPIPGDHDIHHVDNDQQHNAIENLACMLHGEHVSFHRQG